MRILLLEPFYGGSHRDVADGLVAHSRHSVELMRLPARFWKWRMRAASLWFSHQLAETHDYDLVVCTGLMSVADLKALWPTAPPVLLYSHENQLAYPLPEGEQMDLQFGFTDIVNCLVADAITFNSHYHRNMFLDELPRFIRRFPEFRPSWATEEIASKSSVCYPGIRLHLDPSVRDEAVATKTSPLIVWNHRWEFDKQPEEFFTAVRAVKQRGVEFRLALLGENFQMVPQAFVAAKEEFAGEIVQYGYAADQNEYRRWLSTGSVVVSTAIQENFGISILEAIAHGCHPLVPGRLAYPEVIPEAFHSTCLYDSVEDLSDRIAALLEHSSAPVRANPDLVTYARGFEWSKRIGDFDATFERVAGMESGSGS